MKKKLYIITHGESSFYFGGYSLADVAEKYPTADKIEFIDNKLVVQEGDRWDLLKEAYDFISTGANKFTNKERVVLEGKIHAHLFPK